VQDINTVAPQLLGSDMEWVLPRLNETSPDAVIYVGELHSTVAEWATSERVQASSRGPHLVRHLHRVAGQQARIPVAVSDDPYSWSDLCIPLDEAPDGGGKARCESASSKHGNSGDWHRGILRVLRRGG
jgi:hypothetical protein